MTSILRFVEKGWVAVQTQSTDMMGFFLALAFLLIAALVGLWDLYVTLNPHVTGRTVSDWVVQWAHDWPVFPLMVGFVLGHLFFPFRRG